VYVGETDGEQLRSDKVMADITSGQNGSVRIIIYVKGHYQRAAQLF
jgi:hypothetical protein